MLSQDEIKEQWTALLGTLLRIHREENQSDTRSSREILDNLMEHFHKSGTIQKNEDGKYVLGEIIDDFTPEQIEN